MTIPKKRNRNRYPGNPTRAAQQRLVDHLVAAVGPRLTRDAAQEILQAANAWAFIPMRQLDQHLDSYPDALANPDPHAPRCLARLAHAMITAGYADAVVSPACVVCGRAKPNFGSTSEPHPEGIGRCCAVCMVELRVRACARCGELGPGVARRDEGVICRRCYNDDPGRLQECARCTKVRPPSGRTDAGEPLCSSCLPRPEHPCTRCGRIAPAQAITAAGRVCNRCYEPPPRPCGQCGADRSIARRARGDLPDLCRPCLLDVVATCDLCGRPRRGRIRAHGRFHCYGCLSRPVRLCSSCGRRRTTHVIWPRGKVCLPCHDQILAAPGVCPGCSRTTALIGIAPSGESACGPCTIARHDTERAQPRPRARAAGAAQRPTAQPRNPQDYICQSCGTSGRTYMPGRCTRCAVTDRVTDLLSNVSGSMSPQLIPFADFLLATFTPQHLLEWLRRSASARLIAQLANTTTPIDHHALDELPSTQELAYLRQLLILGGVLPQRFEPLAALEPWVERQLATRPRGHQLLIQPYAQWVVLRRARRDHRRGRYTHTSATNDRARLRQPLYLLDWLTSRGQTITELTQALLDRWLTEGSARSKREVAQFLAWTAARRLTPKLTVARQRADVPSRFLDEDQHLDLLRRCLADKTMPLTARVAGALILLYGVRVTTISALTTTHLSHHAGGTYINLGGVPALLPPSLAQLINSLIDQPRRFDRTAVQQEHHLFPGRPASRPTNPYALASLLRRHGIPAAASRNTALLGLAAELPAPVLATLIGLAPSTADDWSR